MTTKSKQRDPVSNAVRSAAGPVRFNGRLGLSDVLSGLAQDGLITEKDALAVRSQVSGEKRVDIHPMVLIANQKLTNRDSNKPLTLEILTQWLSTRAGLPYLKIDVMKIDVAKVTEVISHAYASRYRILPISVNTESVRFATSEPFATDWIDDLKHILRRDIELVVASPIDINRYLMEFYGVNRSVKKASDAKMGNDGDAVINFEQLLNLGEAGKLGADDHHIVHIVDWLLQFAFEQRASDIHLEPRREMSNIRFRIDGHLHTVYKIPTPVMAAVTSRIKILGRMDVAEKRRPQDGRIKTRTPIGQEVELRLSTMPTAFGEKCVMRIFDPDVVAKDFGYLGFSQRETEIWRHMIERPHGIVLVTGPTGSGKTTTLYSTLKYLARPDLNLCTIEDPIEMVSGDFNQMQVHHSIGLDFAAGVRTLMRQDPDIIMVGEIRDLETAQMAIQASLTGHLVLSTLHTNDAPSALVRLLNIGVPHYLLQGTLAGITAQRLVRTLCPHCRKPTETNVDEWEALVHPWSAKAPPKIMQGVGCVECRKTGFLGRTGIYEMLPFNQKMRDAVRADSGISELQRVAREDGMRPLRLGAAELVGKGKSTIAEVSKVLPPEYTTAS